MLTRHAQIRTFFFFFLACNNYYNNYLGNSFVQLDVTALIVYSTRMQRQISYSDSVIIRPLHRSLGTTASLGGYFFQDAKVNFHQLQVGL